MSLSVSYPKASIPILPILSSKAFCGKRGLHYPCIADIGNIVKVTQGSVAIALALQHAKVKCGDKVLVSAYNCRSMVEPILFNSAIPITYRIKQNLRVDLEDIRKKIDQHTKALIVAHYFGFPQDILTIRNFCDKHNLILIEDCAHAFFGSSHGKPLGWFGDYAIASVRKFFPIFDGGYLVSSRHRINNLSLTNGGYKYNLKSMINIIEEAGQYKRMKGLNLLLTLPMHFKNYLQKKSSRSGENHYDQTNQKQFFSRYAHLDIKYFNRQMSFPSRWLVKTVSTSRIIENRRKNFNQFLKELAGVNNCKALFNNLPSHVVPYMFPLLIDKPEIFFPQLKHEGISIWRWDDISRWREQNEKKSRCDISDDYSYRLLQLPCHQELSVQEIGKIIKAIKKIAN